MRPVHVKTVPKRGAVLTKAVVRASCMLGLKDVELAQVIGERIIETAVDLHRTELRDARSGFVAYVPPGSIARGEVIAAKGEGAAQACESCHGPDLRGVGVIPPLAGRSPTYIVRELILFRTSGRSNAAVAPMRAEATQLTLKDMIDVAAYAASRKP